MGKLYHLAVGCADASVISCADATFLVDCHNIEQHAHLLPRSKRLRGVFITHQHYDHYSGLAYLRKKGYTIEHLIYSPYDRRYGDNSVTYEEWNEFDEHRNYFEQNGTKCHKPFRQLDWSKPWWTPNGLKFWIAGPARYIAMSETRELHDACLVIIARMGNRTCCFTGDASDANLEYVATHTIYFCSDILHASHHGSINGAELSFIQKCNAQYTVISTESGVHDNVPHPTAMERYRNNTKKVVFRTDVSGSLSWTF
jgi:beta-lactamase superfamily II metal-dependent hydrolase